MINNNKMINDKKIINKYKMNLVVFKKETKQQFIVTNTREIVVGENYQNINL